jgi:hypothetical protein
LGGTSFAKSLCNAGFRRFIVSFCQKLHGFVLKTGNNGGNPVVKDRVLKANNTLVNARVSVSEDL